MIVVFIAIGCALIVFGLILLAKPDLIAAVERGDNKVVVPAGLVVVVVGLLAVAFPFTTYYKAPPTTGTPSVTPGPAPGSTLPPPPTNTIAITEPKNDSGVVGRFPVFGTAPDLGQDKLWPMIWGENATTPGRVYYLSSDSPISVEPDGTWAGTVGPLGEPGQEIGSIFQVKLIRASPQCSAKIAQTQPNPAGEYFVKRLPAGCTDVATLRVVKQS